MFWVSHTTILINFFAASIFLSANLFRRNFPISAPENRCGGFNRSLLSFCVAAKVVAVYWFDITWSKRLPRHNEGKNDIVKRTQQLRYFEMYVCFWKHSFQHNPFKNFRKIFLKKKVVIVKSIKLFQLTPTSYMSVWNVKRKEKEKDYLLHQTCSYFFPFHTRRKMISEVYIEYSPP